MAIKILCIFEKKNLIEEIIISNHSNFEKKGKDIVCAAVSSISNGALNYFNIKYPDIFYFKINNKETYIHIWVKKTISQSYDLLQENLKMMIYQLENIEKYYSKYLIIVKKKKRLAIYLRFFFLFIFFYFNKISDIFNKVYDKKKKIKRKWKRVLIH